jgi:hypothetical protein
VLVAAPPTVLKPGTTLRDERTGSCEDHTGWGLRHACLHETADSAYLPDPYSCRSL